MKEKFDKLIDRKENMKMTRKENNKTSIWSGFGVFGVIGWSVALLTIGGAALGMWLDKTWPSTQYSFTLTFLVAGLVIGCANAWRWIAKEDKAINKKRDEHDDN